MLPLAAPRGRAYARRYWAFAVPAAAIVVAVIVFPWLFTLFMSVHDWKVTGAHAVRRPRPTTRSCCTTTASTGRSCARCISPPLASSRRCCWASGPPSASRSQFRLRGLARTIFVLPMMATPVAIALVWTMMFHPQLGVLNYLLTSVGLPPVELGLRQQHRDPDAGDGRDLAVDAAGDADRAGRARQPAGRTRTRPRSSTAPVAWQMFRHITLPLVWPFIMVAAVIRLIDALKTFDTIYVITLRRPGHVQRDDQHPALPDRLRLLRPGLRLGDGGGVLRADPADQPAAAARPPAGGMAMSAAASAATALAALGRARRAVFLGAAAGLAGGAVLPVDAVAVAEERAATTWPIRRCSFPHPPTLANFIDVFQKNDFLTYTINSVIVSFTATGLALLFGVPAGYGIAKAKATKAAAADPDRAGHAGPVLPDPAVPAVPVARPDRHADADGHHPSGDHRADRGLDHDRLLRGPAGRAGGSRAGRWRHDLAGVPARRDAAGAARDHGRDDPGVHLLAGTTSSSAWCWRGATTRTLPVAVYNVLTFEQISWGPLAAAALVVTAPVLLLTLLMQKEIVAGLTAGGVKGG